MDTQRPTRFVALIASWFKPRVPAFESSVMPHASGMRPHRAVSSRSLVAPIGSGIRPTQTVRSVTRPAMSVPVIAGKPQQEWRLRVKLDPADSRRARISGSMAEVCAALEGMVHAHEAQHPHAG